MKQQNKYEKLFDEFLDLTEFRLVDIKMIMISTQMNMVTGA